MLAHYLPLDLNVIIEFGVNSFPSLLNTDKEVEIFVSDNILHTHEFPIHIPVILHITSACHLGTTRHRKELIRTTGASGGAMRRPWDRMPA